MSPRRVVVNVQRVLFVGLVDMIVREKLFFVVELLLSDWGFVNIIYQQFGLGEFTYHGYFYLDFVTKCK